MAWPLIPPFVVDFIFGYQTANKILDRLNALASLRPGNYDLGGSVQIGLKTASYLAVPEWRHPKINGAQLAGMTMKAVVSYRTESTATSVDWQIVDIDNASSVVASGTVYSAGVTWQEETVDISLSALDHRYELQVIGGNANAHVFAHGRIEVYATA